MVFLADKKLFSVGDGTSIHEKDFWVISLPNYSVANYQNVGCRKSLNVGCVSTSILLPVISLPGIG